MRLALFGVGWVQHFHARGVIEHPRAEIAAVANWREPSLAAFAERFGIARTTTTWEDLASDPGIDAVIISTPNVLHAPQAIACLQAGKHVLVEKPMATSVVECDAMIAAARSSGASLMVAHCWRFRDEVRAMRARIEAGELGEIVKTRGYGVHAGWGPSGWFIQAALAGGGALVDMGVHAIDTARFVLGDPMPGPVCARIGTRYGGGRYEVDDDATLLVSWSNGTNSIVEAGWWHPHLGGLEADTEVYGTGGYARIFPPEPPADGYEHVSQPMFTNQIAEFIDAIDRGRDPRPNGDDGRIVMQIVEAAHRSSIETAAT
jgi:predicted dehydrogenase